MVRTYQGVVYPAQCDAMGHMNVQHYVAAFDQAFWHTIGAAGCHRAEEGGPGWAAARYEIDFRSELRVGELFVVDSAVIRLGRSSLTIRHVLSGLDPARVASELRSVSVFFDLDRRQATPMPDPVRSALSSLVQGQEEQ